MEPDGDREGEVAGVAEADVDVVRVDPGLAGQLGGAAAEVHLGPAVRRTDLDGAEVDTVGGADRA